MELYQFKTKKDIKIGNKVFQPDEYILLSKYATKWIDRRELEQNNIVLSNIIQVEDELYNELNIDNITKSSIPFIIANRQLVSIYVEKMFWLNYINIHNIPINDIILNKTSILLAVEDRKNNKIIEIYPLYKQKPRIILSKTINHAFMLDREYMYIGNHFRFMGINIETAQVENLDTENLLIEYPVQTNSRIKWKVIPNVSIIDTTLLFNEISEWRKININDNSMYFIRMKMKKNKLEFHDVNIASNVIDLSSQNKLYDKGYLYISTNDNNIVAGSVYLFAAS